MTSGQVGSELQLSGGILRSDGWLTEVFYRRSFTRVAPRGVFPLLRYHLSPQLRDALKLPSTVNYFLSEVTARSSRSRITGERLACVRASIYLVMNVILLSWCPVRTDTFISDLPKADPDGMWSSNALQAEENRVCFHRSDDAYLTCGGWWQHWRFSGAGWLLRKQQMVPAWFFYSLLTWDTW